MSKLVWLLLLSILLVSFQPAIASSSEDEMNTQGDMTMVEAEFLDDGEFLEVASASTLPSYRPLGERLSASELHAIERGEGGLSSYRTAADRIMHPVVEHDEGIDDATFLEHSNMGVTVNKNVDQGGLYQAGITLEAEDYPQPE